MNQGIKRKSGIKRFCVAWAMLCLAALLGGCTDYRGLDQLTIVAGLALDESREHPGWYALTMELVDTATPSEQGQVGSVLLKTEGPTIFEAIHNSNKQLHREMYFGNMEVMVIGYQLAETKGIAPIVDAFLRDFSTRDDLSIIVSREETAGDLIEPEKDGNVIVSYRINDGLHENMSTINSTRSMPLYKVYDTLAMQREQLAVPAMRFLDKEKKLLTTDGLAVFREDRLINYLSDDSLPAFLLATEKLADGTFTFDAGGSGKEEDLVTLSVIQSEPARSLSFDGEKLTIRLHVKVLSRAIEVSPHIRSLKSPDMITLEQRANQELQKRIEELIRSVQSGSGSDIFHFGTALYRSDPMLWEELSGDWEEHFRGAQVEVSCEFTINDTGLIAEYDTKYN